MYIKELFTKTINSIDYREDLEWSNFWYDSANKLKSNRLLVVGDSTVRMIRSTLAHLSGYTVDLFGSSSQIDDILFINQLECFFATIDYRYEAIFVQVGHHGRTSINGGEYQETDYLRYENSIRLLLKYLQQFSDKIIVETIFDSVISKHKNRWYTPILFKIGIIQLLHKIGFRKEHKDSKINAITRKKNDILRSISIGLSNVMFLDINEIMNNTNFIHIDHIHFEEKAKDRIVHEMIKML